MSKRDRCKCLHCKEVFQPDRHNWWHQKFCAKPECRQASKAQSQRVWLKRPENRDVFRGSANVHRVRQWRDKHPGYWKRRAKETKESSPESVAVSGRTTVTCDGKTSCNVPPPPLPTAAAPLQDFVLKQNPLLVGLIAHLIDSPLQENVEQAARRLLQKGQSILGMKPGGKTKDNTHANYQTSALPGAAAPSAAAVQLGGPTPGAPAPCSAL